MSNFSGGHSLIIKNKKRVSAQNIGRTGEVSTSKQSVHSLQGLEIFYTNFQKILHNLNNCENLYYYLYIHSSIRVHVAVNYSRVYTRIDDNNNAEQVDERQGIDCFLHRRVIPHTWFLVDCDI